MDLIENFRAWCLSQRETLIRGLEMMETGVMRTGEKREGGPMRDTTPETIASHRRQLKELDELLTKIEQDRRGSAS